MDVLADINPQYAPHVVADDPIPEDKKADYREQAEQKKLALLATQQQVLQTHPDLLDKSGK